jgi:hypothetical protein
MNWARRETIKSLFKAACEMPVVDCHTHVQDDLANFDAALAAKNLAGTQAAMNAYPEHILATAVENGRLVRRTMMDVAHGSFYSWFAEIVEGNRGQLDEATRALGGNSKTERDAAGRMMIEELQEGRFTEYAEWLRFMFRLYDGDEQILIHTPHLEDKYQGTRMILNMLTDDSRINRSRVLVDHVEEHTVRWVLEAGFWAGMTLYPVSKCTPERAVDMIEQYGPERLLVNSAGDWGPSKPTAVPDFILEMRRRRHDEQTIRRVVYENPVEFFSQSRNFAFTPPEALQIAET